MNGTVWRTVADPSKNILFVECRNPESKTVTFSALDLDRGQWLWRDVTFDERWWISLAGVSGDILLLTVYNDSQNPDRTSVVAFHMAEQRIVWWKNNFAIGSVSGAAVRGLDTQHGSKEITVSASDGEALPADTFIGNEQNLKLTRPLQYGEGTPYFETVRAFLETKCQFSAVGSIEYCEYDPFIIISAFAASPDLANYLIVCDTTGKILLKKTLGEHLKGIAADTFFIFSGYLIFVCNKCELVSYKFV